jgi:hypothetical protein
MTRVDIINGELALLDYDGEIEYVWERNTMSRSQYTYMSKYIIKNWHDGWENDKIWTSALNKWDSLSPEVKGFLTNLSDDEEKAAHRIYIELRRFLEKLPCLENIKKKYDDAIIDTLNSIL